MAAAATVNRPPPAHPGPNGGNLHSHANSGMANTMQQDPRLQCISQNPGSSSHHQHPVFARPVFYIQTPPPPPFLHYQWPMPLSYNPFGGFPGMGYGMAMSPFPLPPYIEAPPYVLPQPHIQPVDYRRLFRPQVHTPLYENPTQTHRIRMPHAVPVRETVNCEVQTEPTHRVTGDEVCTLVGSDSGNATASNSPSSSSLSSEKQSSTKAEGYTSLRCNAKDSQVNRSCTSSTVRHDFNIIHPTGANAVSYIRSTQSQRCKDSIGQVPPAIPLSGNGLSNMWSVSSPDSIVPVCSSAQREDEIIKERRISVPDILMSWGGCTPQTVLKMADRELPQNTHKLPSYETEVVHEKCIYLSPTEEKNVPVLAGDNDAVSVLSATDCEMLKILRLPSSLFEPFSEPRQDIEPVELVGSVSRCLIYGDELLHSRNTASGLLDNEQENGKDTDPQDSTTETIPYQMSLSSCQIKRKMNESVWSVESLAPFIPTKEWLLHNVFEPKVTEVTEEAGNEIHSSQNDNLIAKASKERRQTRRFSSSDFVPMSESLLIFSTPAEKPTLSMKPQADDIVSENKGPKHDQNMAPSENNYLTSMTSVQSKNLSTPSEEGRDENGSSEPGANQSPNQESAIVNEQQEKSICSPDEETTLLSSAAEEKISFTSQLLQQHGVGMVKEDGPCVVVGQVRKEELCVPVVDQKMAEVSPSKRHLVDCGIQCTELLELKCQCEPVGSIGPNERHPFKYSDTKKANNGTNEQVLFMNGLVQKNSKRNGQWRNRGHEQHRRQQEAYSGHSGKPGRSKGGIGRNPQY